jgi:hypothetical protein
MACTQVTASNSATALPVSGTDVGFAKVKARGVRVRIDDVSGIFYGIGAAVLARSEAP